MEKIFLNFIPMFNNQLFNNNIVKYNSLQVITKIQTININEKIESYKGGVWHLEGLKEEHILGTGIYYYIIFFSFSTFYVTKIL